MHKTELSLVCRVLGQSSTQLDAIRATLISSNKHSSSSKAAPCQHSWYLSAASPQEPPPQPTSQQLRSAHYTWSLQMGELTATSAQTQEICVVFQTNPTETRITTMLSQISYLSKLSWSRAAVQLYLEVPSWSACYSEHTCCQGNSHSQQQC